MTFPRSDLSLKGAELSQSDAPPKSGRGPSSGRARWDPAPFAVGTGFASHAATRAPPVASIEVLRKLLRSIVGPSLRSRGRRPQLGQTPAALLEADCAPRRR